MYNSTVPAIDIDAMLRDTANADNAALPYEQWKQQTLDVANKTPAHEADVLFVFEERAAKRRKRISRVTVCAASVAAASLIFLSVNANMKAPDEIYGASAAAPQAAPIYVEDNTFSAGAGQRSDNGVNDITPESEAVQEAPQAAMLAPEIDDLLPKEAYEPYSGSEPRVVPSGLEAEAILAVISWTNHDAATSATATLVEDGWFTVNNGDFETQVTVAFAYAVQFESGERYLVDADSMRVLGLIVE